MGMFIAVPDDNYFNVSCEAVGYKPISLQEVKQRMEKVWDSA